MMKFFTFLTNALAITNSHPSLSTVDTLKSDLTNILEKPLTHDIYTNNVKLCLDSYHDSDNSIVKKFKGKKNYLRQLNKLRVMKKIKIVKDIKLNSNIYEIDENIINVESICSLYIFFAKKPLNIGISSNYILNNENKIQKHIINNLIINNKTIDVGYLTQKYIDSTSSIDRSFCGLIIFIILTNS